MANLANEGCGHILSSCRSNHWVALRQATMLHVFKIVLQWEKRRCLRDDIQNLVNHHDYHHRPFKKLVAENKPFEYQMASNLLSFAGFLR